MRPYSRNNGLALEIGSEPGSFRKFTVAQADTKCGGLRADATPLTSPIRPSCADLIELQHEIEEIPAN